ncbi:hypothetical protein [Aquabacterium sp.]|uniref:hypothetical protein n=1 Tax=Aquabacterium sp. TaxID=1872578 RepID=UPI0024880411|nr:hypothetical protein [Aquabacterium sp.]MDI1258914.1 hypothetical protein [Aquabacterium sp.]
MTAAANTGFSTDWLRQREPFDLAARSQSLATGFQGALRSQAGGALRIVDLASGSGANFRALAPLLGTDQEWRLVDHDPLLLAAQRTEITKWASGHGWHCHDHKGALAIHAGPARWLVRGQQLDLASDLEDIDLASCDGLVTTAFLDLVSAAWLDRLSALLARTRRPLLATLTVDGRRTWFPGRPADHLLADAFLAHQGGDKGFGPSLGVRATPYLAASLATAGYQNSTQASDWHIGHEHRDMLLGMAKEAAAVAAEADPSSEPAVSSWLADRSTDICQGLLSLQVGHLDLLAVPIR